MTVLALTSGRLLTVMCMSSFSPSSSANAHNKPDLRVLFLGFPREVQADRLSQIMASWLGFSLWDHESDYQTLLEYKQLALHPHNLTGTGHPVCHLDKSISGLQSCTLLSPGVSPGKSNPGLVHHAP
eukprot:1350390-Rhodomonas_salina.2